MIPLFKVFNPSNIGPIIEKIFESGFITEGQQSDEFENSLCEFIKNPYSVLVNSCTSALTLAYHLSGVEKDSEIIVTPLTCMATNEPAFNLGAKLVFADIDPHTGNICPDSVRKKITNKTKAIAAVHLDGQPFNISVINSIARENNIKVIEDAAHALGASYEGRNIGSLYQSGSDFVCFSFQAIKHLTTGDGGLLACKNSEDAERAKKLRWFGLDRKYKGNKWSQDITECGYKFHMNNIVASIGLEQMKHIDKIISAHRSPQRMYEYAAKVEQNNIGVIIAGAGGSAHLPGMISALAHVPVLGVPVESKKLKGLDSLLSIAQMPKGIPVGTLAIGEDGAINAALLAAAIIANNNSNVRKKLKNFRTSQTKSVKKSPK